MVKVLLKRASYVSIGDLVGYISTSISAIIIARHVGSENFGVYAAIWALVSLCVALSEIGLSIGLQQEGARFPEKLPVLLGNTLLVRIGIALVAFIIVYVYTFFISLKFNDNSLYFPLALAGFSVVSTEPFFSVLQVKGLQKIASLIQMGRGLLFLAGTILISFMKVDILIYSWFQGILYISTLLCVLMTVPRIAPVAIGFSQIKTQVRDSLPFGVSGMIYAIYSQLPILILAYFYPGREVGIYATAARFVDVIFIVGAGVNNKAFLPLLFGLYSSSLEKFRKVSDFMQKGFTLLGIFLAVLLFISSDALILILVGKDFVKSIVVNRILCWSIFVNFCIIGAGATITASDRISKKIVFQLTATVLGAIFGLLLIRKYMAYGAAFTALFVCFILAVLYLPFALRHRLLYIHGYRKILFLSVVMLLLGGISMVIFKTAYLMRIAFFLISTFCLCASTFVKMFKDYVHSNEALLS